MNLKHIIGLCGSTIIISTVVWFAANRSYEQKDDSVLTIGILQTASHPALDAAREGFVEYLTEKVTDRKIEWIVHNGQGSVSQLQSMAQSLHANKKIDAFYAIATPAAQTMVRVEKERPIVIAAVTDPQAAGLMHPQTNVCGTQDMIDVRRAIELITAFVPQVKKIAMLYSSGEVNSCVMVKKMEQELSAHGIVCLHAGITSETDLPAAVAMACKNADVLWSPTDNIIAMTAGMIAHRAQEAKKPFIVSDNELVNQGALAACGIDYRASAQQSAAIVLQVLHKHKAPTEIGAVPTESTTIFVNKKTLEVLELKIPQNIGPLVLI